MEKQLDIFSYPDSPGWKRRETSRLAALAIRDCAYALREQALESLRSLPQTADEVAEGLRESVLAIRPRITELNKKGLIKDSGFRRENRSGKKAIVWEANNEG